jgi:hypothetical protein
MSVYFIVAYNEQGFLQVGEIEFRPPEPLLIENILMKLKLMLNNVCPARNQCLALQFAEA